VAPGGGASLLTEGARSGPAEAVVVECRYQGLYKPTGKSMDIQACHIWKVADGRLKGSRQYIDTARLQEIMWA
jgi:uncharacterized protein